MKPLLLFTFYLLLKTASIAQAVKGIPPPINKLLEKNTCLNCHRLDSRIIGPSYTDIAKRNYTSAQIVSLIYKPKPENWPEYAQMPPMPQVPKIEAKKMADWIAGLGKPTPKKRKKTVRKQYEAVRK